MIMNEILNKFLDMQLEVEKKEAEQGFLIEQQLGMLNDFETHIKENYDIDSMSYSPKNSGSECPEVFINASKKECLKIMYDCEINYMCLRANHENYTLILVLGLRP